MPPQLAKQQLLCVGFGLFELLLVVSLTAIFGWVAVSGWHYIFAAQQRAILLSQLQQSINFARQAAIAEHTAVALCAAASDQTCGSNWAQGILIFLSTTKEALPSSILMRTKVLSKYDKVTWQGFSQKTQIRFEPDGFPHGTHGSFYVTQRGVTKPLLVMNALGRVRVVTTS